MSTETRPACELSEPLSYPAAPRAKACSACGAEFLCGLTETDGSCWCDHMPNVMPLLSPTDGCLCQACLQGAIDRRLAETADSSPSQNQNGIFTLS